MAIKNIFILTKLGDSTLITHTRILSKWLLENGYNVFMHAPSPSFLPPA